MTDFRRLSVWQKAHELTLAIYRRAAELPALERYELAAQMRRAASSIPMNLAEGSGRSTDRDYGRFVSNAIGSASELEYQLLLAGDLGYGSKQEIDRLKDRSIEVRRMLISLRHTLTAP